MDEEVVFSIAVHESAHAVAAVYFELGLIRANLDIEGDECFIEHIPFNPPDQEFELLEKFAVMCLAGFAAQRLHNPRIDVQLHLPHVTPDFKAVQECIDAVGDQTLHPELRQRWSFRARDFVAENWASIERVAEALYQDKSLSAEEVQALIGADRALSE